MRTVSVLVGFMMLTLALLLCYGELKYGGPDRHQRACLPKAWLDMSNGC